MKTKSFDELFTGSYLPLAEEERARFSAGLLEEQSKTTPTPDSNPTDTNNNVNNSSAYR